MINDSFSTNVMALCVMISVFLTNFKNKNLKKNVDAKSVEDVKKISIFNIGEKEENKEKYTGKVWISNLDHIQKGLCNITFEPNCKTIFHVNNEYKIIVGVLGIGEYQKENSEIKNINFGDIIFIESEEKYWVGAKENSWFSIFVLCGDKKYPNIS